MSKMKRAGRSMSVLAAVSVLALAPLALGQTPKPKKEPMKPPTPMSTGGARSAWKEYLAFGFLGVMVLVVNCIPSKRGHQD